MACRLATSLSWISPIVGGRPSSIVSSRITGCGKLRVSGSTRCWYSMYSKRAGSTLGRLNLPKSAIIQFRLSLPVKKVFSCPPPVWVPLRFTPAMTVPLGANIANGETA